MLDRHLQPRKLRKAKFHTVGIEPSIKLNVILLNIWISTVNTKVDKNSEKLNLIIKLIASFIDKDGQTPLHIAASESKYSFFNSFKTCKGFC